MALNDALLRDLKFSNGDLVNKDGDLATQDGIENVRQALYRRLVTTPGSLVHRPTYGVGIKQWQGALQSFENQQAIASRIEEQFARDERIESVDHVRITVKDDEPEKTLISVRVKVVGYGERVIDFLPFDVGSATF